MPAIQATISCPIQSSFRVQQIAGLFDVPLAERATESFTVELPSFDEPWQIGVIVGPSGSGKTTIARAAFGDAVYQRTHWPRNRAVIDCFGEAPTKQIAAMLTAVGFSSPPSWIKPYWALSNGEQFRCDLARALLYSKRTARRDAETQRESNAFASLRLSVSARQTEREESLNGVAPLVVFDEFTSVVDRTVAKIGSAAVSKAIRRGHDLVPNPQSLVPNPRFVAVTCHYDVVPWLEPDWVLDMATGELSRRRLRRPSIQLAVVRCRRSVWRRFERHHYLSGQLASGASCYAAIWNDEGWPDLLASGVLPEASDETRCLLQRRFCKSKPGYPLLQTENAEARRDAETQREQGSSASLRLSVSARERNRRSNIAGPVLPEASDETTCLLPSQVCKSKPGHPDNVVAFCATVGLYGRRGRKRITRIVVLPDYQGLGIGMQLAEHVAAYEATRGFRCNLTASHPAVIAHCQRSSRWQTIGIKRAPGRSFQTSHGGEVKTAVGRSVVSFEYRGESASVEA